MAGIEKVWANFGIHEQTFLCWFGMLLFHRIGDDHAVIQVTKRSGDRPNVDLLMPTKPQLRGHWDHDWLPGPTRQ